MAITSHVPPCVTQPGMKDMLRRARAARRAACLAEMHDDPACVDRYYESAVFARFALESTGDATGWENSHALDLHNDSLADTLRTGTLYGRLDPRSSLLVNGPRGACSVPIEHRGFVWSPGDFTRLANPRDARPNQYQKVRHRREGLGAAQVVVRPNPRCGPRDQFFPPMNFFPATAIVRPDPGTWLGINGATPGRDVLELHDPYRVRQIDLAGRPVSLAADPDAAIAMAENIMRGQRSTWMGFLNPAVEFESSGIGLLEPYRPGQVVVVFVHGLLDNPYIFSDAIADLSLRSEFLDRVQIAVFKYPTGAAFLRSGAMFRKQLSDLAATFDPVGTDPGMRSIVLVGYSMGGLLSKLQVTSSGDSVWSVAFSRPPDSIVASESTKNFLRDLFHFEPQPSVTRVIYMATPHDGSELATRMVGQIGSRMITRPEESLRMIDQLNQNNPGAVQLDSRTFPNSIDLLARRGPLLTAMQSLPVNPAVRYHTIAGTGVGPASCSRGDLVVPLESALIPGATSELLVPATHFNIYRHPTAIDELERIIREQVDEIDSAAPPPRTSR